MTDIGKTDVFDAVRELGKISKYLDLLSTKGVNEGKEIDEAKKIDEEKKKENAILAKGDLKYHMGRIIVISAVSFFEQKSYAIIKDICQMKKKSKKFADKMIDKKYYSIFKFRNDNIDNFYETLENKIYGRNFKKWCKEREKKDNMSECVKSFIFMHRTRNVLAHEGYGKSIPESEELCKHFRKSYKLLIWISNIVHEFEENRK